MSDTFRSKFVTAVCTVALLFAVAITVEAQTNDPIMDDELVCSIDTGPDLYVTRVDLQFELEQTLGAPATVETLGSLTQRLEKAMPGEAVRFEGAMPGESTRRAMGRLGYAQMRLEAGSVPGADEALVCTL